jgi:H+/Cl- antiporter ClcA
MSGSYVAALIVGLGLLLVAPVFIRFFIEMYLEYKENHGGHKTKKGKDTKNVKRAKSALKVLEVDASTALTKIPVIPEQSEDEPAKWQYLLFSAACFVGGVYTIVYFIRFEEARKELDPMEVIRNLNGGDPSIEGLIVGLYSIGGKWLPAGALLFLAALSLWLFLRKAPEVKGRGLNKSGQ